MSAPGAREVLGVPVAALEAHGVASRIKLVELRPHQDPVPEVHLPMGDERTLWLLLELDAPHGVAHERMAMEVAEDVERVFRWEGRVVSRDQHERAHGAIPSSTG